MIKGSLARIAKKKYADNPADGQRMVDSVMQQITLSSGTLS
jgi:hypothetical protein